MAVAGPLSPVLGTALRVMGAGPGRTPLVPAGSTDPAVGTGEARGRLGEVGREAVPVRGEAPAPAALHQPSAAGNLPPLPASFSCQQRRWLLSHYDRARPDLPAPSGPRRRRPPMRVTPCGDSLAAGHTAFSEPLGPTGRPRSVEFAGRVALLSPDSLAAPGALVSSTAAPRLAGGGAVGRLWLGGSSGHGCPVLSGWGLPSPSLELFS